MDETPHTRLPFSVMTKPTGAACNLDCSYCFFLSKEVLWGESSQRMSQRTLEVYIRELLASQPDGSVTLGWQGGEPTMRGLEFFEEAIRLTEVYRRPAQVVTHSIQTNGTLLTDEWARFFAKNRFLVGISSDGPPSLHDRFRTNKAGRGTYDQVRRGWDLLQTYGVETNILCAVSSANAGYPIEVYRHFRDELGARFIQFIPIVERVEPGNEVIAERGFRDENGRHVLYRQVGDRVTSRTVNPRAWGDFLVSVFDEWLDHDVGTVFVQHFDVTFGALFGHYTLCVHAPECGTALAMEHDGDVYSCDHFVEPGFDLGNIADRPFIDMLTSPEQTEFGRSKRTSLPRQCRECPVRWACNGGCPKDRFAVTTDHEPGLNYLCHGYFSFFTHIQPTLERMAQLIRSGRDASQIGARP